MAILHLPKYFCTVAQLNSFGNDNMTRLSLADLKLQSAHQVTSNLDAIKGGDASGCHCQSQGVTLGQLAGTFANALYEAAAFFATIYAAVHGDADLR
jgi:hypothetical protein